MVRCHVARPALDRVLATHPTILEIVSTCLLSFLRTFPIIPCELKDLLSLHLLMVVFYAGIFKPKSFHRCDLENSHTKMIHFLVSSFFLISIACICIAYVARGIFGRGRYTPWERIIYAPVYALARVLWRVEIEWRGELGDAVPSVSQDERDWLLGDRMSGGAVLIANHRCSMDPFFIQLIGGRRVHWMVAGEYFRNLLFGPILRMFQAIPTNRGGVDTASTKRAIALAKSGRFVGMFPEGRINRSKSPLLAIRPGAAIVALRANVPLVPVWIEGAPAGWAVYSALFVPAKVRIIVGNPDRFDANVQAAANSTEPENESKRENEARESGNVSYDRIQSRNDAIAWLSRVMGESLRMGGHSPDDVGIAGRKWLDS